MATRALAALTPEERATVQWVKERAIREYETNAEFRAHCSPYYMTEIQWEPDLLRFCRARRWDKPAIMDQLLQTMKWRNEFGVHLMKETDINPAVLAAGLTYFNAYPDNEGRPVSIIHVAHNHKKGYVTDDLNKYTIYCMEFARKLVTPEVDRFTIVFDMTGFGAAHMDLGFVRFFVHALERHYPETLAHILVFRAPWVFQPFWNMISPWLDEVVRAKIKFVKQPEDLFKFIPAHHLPKSLGGQLDDPAHPILPSEYYPQHIERLRALPRECLTSTLLPEHLGLGTLEEYITRARSGALAGASGSSGEVASPSAATAAAGEAAPLEAPRAAPADERPDYVAPELTPASQLVLRHRPHERSTATLVVANRNAFPIAFKVRTTTPTLFGINPTQGRVDADGRLVITVRLKGPPPSENEPRCVLQIVSRPLTAEEAAATHANYWDGPAKALQDTACQQRIRVLVIGPDDPEPTNAGSPAEDGDPAKPKMTRMVSAGSASLRSSTSRASLSSSSVAPPATAAPPQRAPSTKMASQDDLLAIVSSLDGADLALLDERTREVVLAMRSLLKELLPSGVTRAQALALAGPAERLGRAVQRLGEERRATAQVSALGMLQRSAPLLLVAVLALHVLRQLVIWML